MGSLKKNINRILWKAKDHKEKFLNSPADLKRNRPTQYGAIEERVVAFVTLLCNMPKPLPVSFSIIKAKAEEMAKSLGETNFKASSGWWEKVRKRNGIGKSVGLHGKAGEVAMSKSKVKLMKLERTLKVMTQKTSTIEMKQAYTSSSFLIPHSTYTARNEDEFEERGHRKRKFESHSLLALMPQELTSFLWQ